ncbi:MAG: lipopolysaccharide biosynthesis protein [Candidatus Thorarchaeota archaeon]
MSSNHKFNLKFSILFIKKINLQYFLLLLIMEKKNFKNTQFGNNQEYKNLASNTFYSFLINYGSHFFTLIYSFFLARLIGDESWGFLILAISYITIIVIITSFLPPGSNFALNYFIPRYLALDEKSKIKSLIKNAIIAKIIFLLPIFILSLFFFNIFTDIFAINLKNKVPLLYVLSPLIIFKSLQFSLNAINRGLYRFKQILIFLIIREFLYIGPLFYFYIFQFPLEIELIAIFNLISAGVPFFLNLFSILFIYLRIKTSGDKGESFKADFNKAFRYGSYLGYSNIIDRFWKEAQFQGIGIFGSEEAVTGYNIAWNYKDIAAYTVNSFNLPLLTSFSSLNTKENYDQVSLIYKIANKVTLFLVLLISGVLLFSVNFIIDFIFLSSRLVYSNFLRLLVLASIFMYLDSYVQTLLGSQNKVKSSFLLKLIYMTYYIPLFFIGLIYFGVEGAIILGLIVGSIISMIIQIIATYQIANIKLNIKKIIFQYLTFFIPLGVTLILEGLFFRETSFKILQNLGLSLIVRFDFLSIGVFVILFLLTNLILKIVTSSDIAYFETLFEKDRFFDKAMLKGLNLLKKVTRE